MSGLTFYQLQQINYERCTAPEPDGFNHPLHKWSLAEWTNAMAGEAGEACGVAKKLIRIRDGINKSNNSDAHELRLKLADELADTVLYADLAAQAAGINLGEAVRQKFNQVSVEEGFPFRL